MNQCKSTFKWLFFQGLTLLLVVGTGSANPSLARACCLMLGALSFLAMFACLVLVISATQAKPKNPKPDPYVRPVPYFVEAITDLGLAFLTVLFSGSLILFGLFVAGSFCSWIGREGLIELNKRHRGEQPT